MFNRWDIYLDSVLLIKSLILCKIHHFIPWIFYNYLYLHSLQRSILHYALVHNKKEYYVIASSFLPDDLELSLILSFIVAKQQSRDWLYAFVVPPRFVRKYFAVEFRSLHYHHH